MNIRYFELVFKDEYSMIIKAVRQPTIEEAEQFIAEDMKTRPLHYDHIEEIHEWTEEDARSAFDFDNEDNWPIFGAPKPTDEVAGVSGIISSIIKKLENAVDLGRSVFIDWKTVDQVVSEWAAGYFGNEATQASMSGEEDVSIFLKDVPSNAEAFEKFKNIFDKYDVEGFYDPKDEFEDIEGSDVNGYELPVGISTRIMAELVQEAVGFKPALAIADYKGLFLFECSLKVGII